MRIDLTSILMYLYMSLQELPSSYEDAMKNPWKHLYLQYNLQELVSKLNDNPDFKVPHALALTVCCLNVTGATSVYTVFLTDIVILLIYSLMCLLISILSLVPAALSDTGVIQGLSVSF